MELNRSSPVFINVPVSAVQGTGTFVEKHSPYNITLIT